MVSNPDSPCPAMLLGLMVRVWQSGGAHKHSAALQFSDAAFLRSEAVAVGAKQS